MKIVIGNDHAAVDMKWAIKEYMEFLGYKVINVGTNVPMMLPIVLAAFK